jgi:very-short-patch-repair endonuclease
VTHSDHKLPDYILVLCREFRKHLTGSEALLWRCLRNRSLNGLKFRRQYPIGRSIIDFYCHEHRLVVEVDGGIHLGNDQRLYDVARQHDLEDQGYTVLRLKAVDVEVSPERALGEILCTVHAL